MRRIISFVLAFALSSNLVISVSMAQAVSPAVPEPPRTMDYNGGPIPLGYHVENHSHTGYAIAGALVALAGVGAILIASGMDEYKSACDRNDDGCKINNSRLGLELMGGVAILGGAGLVIGGMSWSSEKLVRDKNLLDGTLPTAGGKLVLTRLGTSGSGLSFQGVF